MNEQIQEILERDIVASPDRKQFSTPSELTDWVNLCLVSAYSAKAISESLKSLGWKCSIKPIKRNRKACRYYFKENLGGNISYACLKPTDERSSMGSISPQELPADKEDLKSINHRFLKARADKETALSKTRAVETNTASHREAHLEIQLAKERREFVSIADVIRDWEIALTQLRISLYTMPNKISARWASMDSETDIQEEMKKELDVICDRLATAGRDVISEDGDGQFKTKEKTKPTEVDGSTP